MTGGRDAPQGRAAAAIRSPLQKAHLPPSGFLRAKNRHPAPSRQKYFRGRFRRHCVFCLFFFCWREEDGGGGFGLSGAVDQRGGEELPYRYLYFLSYTYVAVRSFVGCDKEEYILCICIYFLQCTSCRNRTKLGYHDDLPPSLPNRPCPTSRSPPSCAPSTTAPRSRSRRYELV
jgi:hypothetical protein